MFQINSQFDREVDGLAVFRVAGLGRGVAGTVAFGIRRGLGGAVRDCVYFGFRDFEKDLRS